MAQDPNFGINPQLGLTLHQMAGPEERATTRAKLEDLQAQVQERAGNAQKTQLANQQTQTKMGAEAAVRKMLQDKQAAGQDPTATDFLMLLGPSEGTVAAKAFNDSQKQAIDNHKAQLDEMQRSVDALANLANDMLSTKDPVIRAQKRDQGITALHGVNGGVLDPKLADAFMKMGLTDSELQTSLSQSIPAMKNALDQQKQRVDEAKIKQENDFKLVDQKRQADELALSTRKQDFEEKKPVTLAPNATMATPQGAPIFTAPPPPPTVPQPTAPMSPERLQQEKDLISARGDTAVTTAAAKGPAVQLIQTVDDAGNKVQKFVPKVAGGAMASAPTAQEQNRRNQASTVSQDADRIIAMIDKNPSAVGPILGRIARGETILGVVPPEAKQLATALGSFEALQPILHGFRGGSNTMDHFHSVIGDQKLNAEALKASIREIKVLAEGIRTGKIAVDDSGAAAPASDSVIEWGRDAKGNPIPLKK